jgi:magnesium transporter
LNSRKTFYLSRILGGKIITDADVTVGRIVDFAVDVAGPRPLIVGVIAKGRREGRAGTFMLDFAHCRVRRVEHRYYVVADEVTIIPGMPEGLLYVRRHMLDRQIVDVDGRKLVRVNDVMFDRAKEGVILAAVDVGFEGLLRRLGIARAASFVSRFFGGRVSSKLILWKDVETVEFPSHEIKLATAHSKLATFHPSDIADILEDLDRDSQVAVFNSLDEEKAADVLEALEPEAQVDLIESLSVEKAADVLEKMPADEAADILDDMEEEKVEELLSEMEGESSEEVRSLLEYEENTVGSLMSRDFVALREGLTVGKALAYLRKTKPEAEAMYSIFVVDSRGKYKAAVGVREIVVSEEEASLGDIMSEEIEPVLDTEDIYSIADLLLKYKIHALPVADSVGKLVGAIVIEDVLDDVIRRRRKH